MTDADRLRQSLFITGIHRSGTSWVGRVLAAGKNFVIKDEEIFNPTDAGFPTFWYQYICKENEGEFTEAVEAVLHNRYGLIQGLGRSPSVGIVKRAFKYKVASLRRMSQRRNPLILIEPLGLLSAEWFHQRFHTPVLVVIRHPASYASSIRRMGWPFEFSHLLAQPLLVERYLEPFVDELTDTPPPEDLIGHGILSWRILYSIVSRYVREHPDWVFVRHEDLATDSIPQYKALYERLGWEFSSAAEAAVIRTTSGTRAELQVGQSDRNIRDSRETATIWKKRLNAREIDRIRRGVEDVACQWYGDEDW